MTASPPPDIPGLVYVHPVGSGGYADVFLYEQQMPRMPVAVKVLKGEGLTPAVRRQFADEADTMAQLADHPYIVQVFRADTAADGRPYLVMKYYPPPNLAVRARRERFTVEDVLRTGIQLASAVETAHRAGITHRDIKPANVLVSQYGAPGLTDFGIAGRGAAHEEDGDDVGVSVPWAPPEVLFGQSSGDVRADVYSLSATLWHLLAGRSPFEVPGGDNSAYALMPRIRVTPVPSTGRADVPVGLERLLAQAMAKDPASRPVSALAFARALQEIEQEQRFARTAIVVLDDHGQTTLADQSAAAPAPGGGSTAGDGDRTRVRSPRAVQAQAPAPPPAAYGASVRWGPSPGTAAHTPALTGHAAGPAGEPEDGRADEGTVRVDRRAPAATVPAPPAAAAERARLGPGTVLMVLGALVLALVVVGAWALTTGRGGAPQPPPTTAPTVAGPAEEALSIPQTPDLVARGLPGAVRFSWDYAGAERGDTFRVRTGPSAQALGAAAHQIATGPVLSVRTRPGAQRCAQVQVVRRGVASVWSDPACEKAG